jgi:Flp pilus assembly protein TadG
MSRLRDEGGQSTLEFALVLPLFVLILTAIVQFAIVYRHSLELADAVRAGARVAAVSRSAASSSPATAAVQAAASDLPLGTAANPITVTLAAGWTAGADVTVTATYNDTLTIFGMQVISVPLTSSTTERIE